MATTYEKLMRQAQPAKQGANGVIWLNKQKTFGIVRITKDGSEVYMVLPLPHPKNRVFELTRLNGTGNSHRFNITLGQTCECGQQRCHHLDALDALDRAGQLDFVEPRKERGPRHVEVALTNTLGTGWAVSKAGKKYPVAVIKKVTGFRVMVADLKGGTASNDYNGDGYFVEAEAVSDIRWRR